MNVRHIWVDLTSNLKMLVRNKGTLFWSLAFPILFIVIFGSIFSFGGDQSLTLYVQDNDRSTLSSNFTQVLNSTGALELRFLDSGVDLDQTIKDKEIHRLLIIPQGFGETLISTGVASLTLRLDESDQQGSAATYQIVTSVAYEISLLQSSQKISVQKESLQLDEEFKYIDFLLPGILGMTIMTSSIYGAIAVNTRYRKNGILRKVATTPMTKAEWVLSKVSYQIVVSFMSMAALVTVATLAFGVSVHINVLVVLLVVTGSMAFSGMGMIVARFVKDEEAAESAGGAINFPMMFLSGIFFPLEFMPEFLQVVAKAMPLYYLGEGLRDAMISGDMIAALASSAVVFVLGVVIIAVGAVVSSWAEE